MSLEPEPPDDYRWLVIMTLVCLVFYVCVGIFLAGNWWPESIPLYSTMSNSARQH